MKDEKKVTQHRIWFLIGASVVLLLLYLLRMVYLQIIHGEKYLNMAANTKDYKFSITAARGEIVDQKGKPIATNTTGYNLMLNQLLMGEADVNVVLQDLVRILQANGESWNDELLISMPDVHGHYEFTNDPESSRDTRSLDEVKKNLGRQQYATADNVMTAIVEKFELEEYSPDWQRILGGIRYQMFSEGFSNRNRFTLANDISDVTMAIVRENGLNLPGVEIEETAVRTYPDGTLMPHLIGSVGKIMAEDWTKVDQNGNETKPLKDKGYAMNDLIGQSGLESVFEEQLRGIDGERTVTVDTDGNIVKSEITKEPQPGLTPRLTIDSDFQRAVYQALERTILNLQENGAVGAGAEANAGAVVVLDVKTGAVLAMANYPSYDLNLYQSNYDAYANDPALPLYNRCMMGLYTPGSTFKPAVAIAGLLSHTIGLDEKVPCYGYYDYFDDYKPRCTSVAHRGPTSLFTAIQRSCNVFFYDVGRRTTSDVYNEYAEHLGLGVKSGLETDATVGRGLTEYSGRLTHKTDKNYTSSLEIQAAIGQGNTVVTPVQMAVYAATLASHGTRYKAHMVDALLDSNTGEVVEQFEPVILDQLEDDMGAFAAVEEGMVGAAQANRVLANYPLTIASKTGSPQRWESYTNAAGRRKYYTNSNMIAYGPVEDPQIAIGVVIEYGGGGSKAAPIIADIFDAYFFAKETEPQPEGEAGTDPAQNPDAQPGTLPEGQPGAVLPAEGTAQTEGQPSAQPGAPVSPETAPAGGQTSGAPPDESTESDTDPAPPER